MTVTPGRPRAASPQLLEDAAVDLFIENGYGSTTVDAIAQRAGVSRNTFFNYFSAKSDVLWFGADQAIDSVRDECIRSIHRQSSSGPLQCARASTFHVANALANDRVPLAVTQLDVMGSTEEVLQSGLLRISRLAGVYRNCSDVRSYDPRSASHVAIGASILATAAGAAWVSWARAGTSRAPLVEFVEQSFSLAFSGLDSAQW
ncbi:MAG: TetR/AcrR family transcriptional regulator [Microbacteriaceae bacterium]